MLGGGVTVMVCAAVPALNPVLSKKSMRCPMWTECVTNPPWYRETLITLAVVGTVNLRVNVAPPGVTVVGTVSPVGLSAALAPIR